MRGLTMSPFDVIKTFTEKKDYCIDDDEAEKAYIPFLINKTLSFNVETLLYANEMNLNHGLDKKLQYDYYFHSLKKRKYFTKYFKRKKDDDLDLIQKYYGYNVTKAKQALTILTDEQLTTIRKKFEEGGIEK